MTAPRTARIRKRSRLRGSSRSRWCWPTVALVVPNSTVKPADVELVKLRTAEGVDAGRRDVIWILAVGSDARPGQDMNREPRRRPPAGRHEHQDRCRLGDRHPARLLGEHPRARLDKINSALYFGGPELLGRAVGNLVGVQPDYVFVTRFPFFEDMVEDIGGIEVNNPVAFSDESLKPKGFKAGKIHLGGVRRDGVRPDPAQPDPRRLRPLGQPAARAARHPGQDPGQGRHARASSRRACCR